MIELLSRNESSDGSIKYTFITRNRFMFESVYFIFPYDLVDNYAYSICISAQSGCALACSFCATGDGGFFSDLTAEEMVQQVVFIREDLCNKGIQSFDARFHINVMGMGEPLLNYPNLIEFYHLSKYQFNTLDKISISTVGITPKIDELADEPDVNIHLFVSIHSPHDLERQKIIPVGKKYPLMGLINSCKEYSRKKNIIVRASYLLLKDVNDSPRHALAFAKLIDNKHFAAQILLYNDIKSQSFQRPSDSVAELFKDIMIAQGIDAYIVTSRGRDISGGCGQLVANK